MATKKKATQAKTQAATGQPPKWKNAKNASKLKIIDDQFPMANRPGSTHLVQNAKGQVFLGKVVGGLGGRPAVIKPSGPKGQDYNDWARLYSDPNGGSYVNLDNGNGTFKVWDGTTGKWYDAKEIKGTDGKNAWQAIGGAATGDGSPTIPTTPTTPNPDVDNPDISEPNPNNGDQGSAVGGSQGDTETSWGTTLPSSFANYIPYDYQPGPEGEMFKKVFDEATGGTINQFNTSANRLRERLDAANQGAKESALSRNVGRGLSNSGLNDKLMTELDLGNRNAYATGLAELSDRFETQRQQGLQTALGAATGRTDLTKNINQIIQNDLAQRRGLSNDMDMANLQAALNLLTQKSNQSWQGTENDQDRALQEKLAKIAADAGSFQASLNVGNNKSGQSITLPSALLDAMRKAGYDPGDYGIIAGGNY